MKRNKTLIVFIASILVLLGTILTEYIFDRQNENSWVQRFEERLHKEEIRADEKLALFRDSVDVEKYDWNEDVIFLGFRGGDLFFWTNGNVGEKDLYHKLKNGGNFVKINNGFYEVRRRDFQDIEYFALLHVKDTYPYTNKYVKNKFGNFLGISEENANSIIVSSFEGENGQVVTNSEGDVLFYIHHDENYKDRSVNYVLLFFYFLFFISLFYFYDRLLAGTRSLRRQLLYMCGFIGFLMLLRYVMISNAIPASLYRLQIFDTNTSKDLLVSSIGDLLMSSFCVCQVLYITFTNLKINFENVLLKRFRYVFIVVCVLVAYLYTGFFSYAIGSIIENTDVHLNIARVVNIGASSFLAFVAIMMGGLGLLVIFDSVVAVFKKIVSFSTLIKVMSVSVAVLVCLSYFFKFYTNFWEPVFVWVLFLLIAVNKYMVKRDVQRSIYMLGMFLLSIYIVMIAKKNERDKELTQRLDYATTLIEERDENFEQKLREITVLINDSDLIPVYVESDDEAQVGEYLFDDLLDMTGYNYFTDLQLCRLKDSLLVENTEVWGCDDFFNTMISQYGEKVAGTNFYLLADFDGFVAYIGKFVFGETVLYLRFDSTKDNEGSGYPQILSRRSVEGEAAVYPYSYAKYKNGHLIFSSGDFNYYKSVDKFGEHDGIDVMNKDRYSHMLIPVGGNDMLVISLHDSFFTLYYINVLYAFFVCILLSSYGLFFGLEYNVNFKKGTLKARIKNNIISLIFVLFVILTALSIYLNTRSFEERHNAKATELMKYVNKELERLNCVDWQECPEIVTILSEMSEILTIDINIYSDEGLLVGTSRPEIFGAGFDGGLANPLALKHIVRDAEMSYVCREQVGELSYMSAYMPLLLEDGREYMLNVPYFTQNDELNLDIIIMVIIAINIAIVVMVIAFIFSGLVAERVTKPLQMVNDKLKQMRFGGKNEKIVYDNKDEVGALVREYNNMVDKLDDSINKLAKSERESAWREMARQIAHEIKNPLTPMKLNIQFMQRSLLLENPEAFKERFKDVSSMLIEQIDNMASIASAFSDFAKMPIANSEVFDVSDLVRNCARLFENNVENLEYDIESDIMVFADKDQIRRVIVNMLKNAEQCIPEDRDGAVRISVKRVNQKVEIRIKDNGVGIPEELRKKIFEPNFTTKSGGMGLGLAICRRIIESMGGTVDYISTINVGTEFFIVLDYVKL